MRASARQAVRRRFNFRCGYCGVTEVEAGAALTVDHFQPRSRGGTDDADNLVYSCHACNEFKGDHWDPESEARVLHPLFDPLPEHVTERSDGVLEALTPTGAFHIRQLSLNREALIVHRLEHRLRQEAEAREAEVRSRLDRLEQLVQELTDQSRRAAEEE